MSLSTKILLAIGAVLTLGVLGFIIYTQQQLKSQQTAIQTSIVAQQQLVDGIVRSQSQYATAADLAKFASDNSINLKAIQDNLSSLGSQLSSINVISANSTGQTGNNIPSTGTGPANPNPPAPTVPCTNGVCPNQDPYGYQQKQQDLALNEDFATVKVPIGTVGFSAWQPQPWNVAILPREYNVDTVVGVDENQRQTFYNKFTVVVDGKTYDVPIKTATTKQQYPTATFSWWNPRLLLGADGGINVTHLRGEFAPSINLGIMSYGQYKNNPDWSILEVGAGYDAVGKTPQLVVTPGAYNLGKNLLSPLITNAYVGPAVTVGTDGSVGVGLGLRVGL
jgi:hypothetical protein